ncbi:MAG: sigma-54-dependent Fis family transcriptional regulator [Deltaproteobacteria bacterium]|nr:sigma-54-dependent Fis family transcriptional regulator [Deltaproteobacteria bacterium]
MSRLLVVDDDKSMCELLQDGLAKRGHDVYYALSDDAARDRLVAADADIVLTDLKLGNGSGLRLCEWVVANRPGTPVIVMTAFGSMQHAVGALRVGAYDFITKPIDLDTLDFALRRADEHRQLDREVKRLREEVAQARAFAEFIGKSRPMREIYDMLTRIGDADTTVLVTGESGTGKELVARALHQQGKRSERKFVAVNCAAMPAQLLESELFGHARGAFTDAKAARDGLFVQADGGTLFLDEIGELPSEMQPKLLRALQEQVVRPVGSDTDVLFDARIIAATNRDLETDVEEGRFREDLFYRVNVVQVHLPPLRMRGNDALLLAQHFLTRKAAELGKSVIGMTSEVGQRLLDYDWPGNVRELENCIERAVTLTRFSELTVEDLTPKVRNYRGSKWVIDDQDPEQLLTLQQLEERYIRRVLKLVSGNKTQAARVLGLDRRTLYRKLERFEQEV